jgi:hypothetical protein
MVHRELDTAFSKLEDGIREMAWGIVDDVLSLELARRRLGVEVTYPNQARKPMNNTENPKPPPPEEAVTSDMIKVVPGSKRENYLKLIKEGSGLWKRADSKYFYKCKGESKEKPGHYVMQDADGYKELTVSLVTLVSKWQHHPI